MRSIILAGDDKQLPSTVLSNRCRDAFYGRSLFERLISFGWPSCLLDVQYRMNPTIAQWSSFRFYSGLIRHGGNVLKMNEPWYGEEHAVLGSPVAFIDVEGQERLEAGTNSIYNVQEIQAIKSVLKKFSEKYGMTKRPISVGIITPYSAQVGQLTTELSKMGHLDNGFIRMGTIRIDIKSVDGFQGDERDVIIFSCVRTGNRLGFVADHRRLNVACTRAKSSLWIFGRVSTLKKHCEHFASLIRHASQNGRLILSEAVCQIKPTMTGTSKSDNGPARNIERHLAAVSQKSIRGVTTSSVFEPKAQCEQKEDFTRLWQLSVKGNAMLKVRNIEQPIFEMLITYLHALTRGLRPKHRNADSIENEENDVAAKLVNVGHIKGHYLIWTVALRSTGLSSNREQSHYYQVIEIWDLLQRSEVAAGQSAVRNALMAYSDEYLTLCSQEIQMKTKNGKIVYAPCTFLRSTYERIPWYRMHRARKNQDNDFSALAVDKSYRIDLERINDLLRVDVTLTKLPIDMNSTEMDILKSNSSLFVLGRSGTGKVSKKVIIRQFLLYV